MAYKIFISYRRDERLNAAQLSMLLRERFGAASIFIDAAELDVGANFLQTLDRQLAASDAVVALIGKRWTDLKDEHGNRRLDDPHDFVRLEIERALARQIKVMPVLLDGAEMPKSSQLPDPLRPIAQFRAMPLRSESFHTDADMIVRTLAHDRPRSMASSVLRVPIAVLSSIAVAILGAALIPWVPKLWTQITHVDRSSLLATLALAVVAVLTLVLARSSHAIRPRRRASHADMLRINEFGAARHKFEAELNRQRLEASRHAMRRIDEWIPPQHGGEAARAETRHINAWIEDGLPPLQVGRSYRLGLNIGPLRERALAAAVFTEPRSQDQESLNLLVVLSGSGSRVETGQQLLVLPRRGSTAPIFFSLTPLRAGGLILCISFYLARELALLQEFEIPIEAGGRDEPARSNLPSPPPAMDRRTEAKQNAKA